MKHCKDILLLLILIFQQGLLFSNVIKVEHIITDPEMSEIYILSICKDSYGFIWLGTYNGVYRYDGYNCVSPFNREPATSELNKKSVQSIFEDSDTNLWFGTETGLYKFDRKSGIIKAYHYGDTEKNLTSEHIRTIAQSGDKFYLGTYGGGLIVFHTNENRFETFAVPIDSPQYPYANRINGFLHDRKDNIWVATEAGIYTIDENKKEYIPYKGKGEWPTGKTVNCFYEDQKSNIWMGTWDDGLYCYNREKDICTKIGMPEQANNSISKNIRAIVPVDGYNLWLANFWEGMYNYNIETGKTTKIQFIVNEPIKNLALWTMLKDNAGLVWLGGFGGGLFKYNPVINQFKPFPDDNSFQNLIPDAEVSSFTEDLDDNIYIGTNGKGLFKYIPTSKTMVEIIKDSNPNKNIIRVLYTDNKNRIWAGAEGYLTMISKNRKITFENNQNNQDSYGRSGVHAILLDKSDNLWSGVWGEGLYMLPKSEIVRDDPKNVLFKRYINSPDTNSISDNVIWSIVEDEKGSLYIGTTNSLDLFDVKTGVFRHLIKTTTSSVYIDSENVIWIGTYGSGLIKYTPWNNKAEYYNESDGLQSNIVNGVLPGKENELIVVTAAGFSRFLIDSKKFINYSAITDLGIKKMLQHAFIRLRNGMVLIGGAGGIVSFDPEQLIDKLTAYPVYLTDIKVFNKSVLDNNNLYDISTLKKYRFPHTDKMISFEFAALDYSSPQKVKYAYRLEGFNNDWISTDARNRVATYTNLKSGKYVFHVRSTNSEGAWSENEYKLDITITPPFYYTIPFKLSATVVFVLLLVFVYKKKISAITKAFKFKEESMRSEAQIAAIEVENSMLREELHRKNREITTETNKLVEKNDILVFIKNVLSKVQKDANREVKGKIIDLYQRVVRNLDADLDIEEYNQKIDLLQDNFISRFSAEFPDVTHNDLKICAFIRMSKSNQEIAEQLNITSRSLDMARYRIRKRVKLPRNINLNDFIIKF